MKSLSFVSSLPCDRILLSSLLSEFIVVLAVVVVLHDVDDVDIPRCLSRVSRDVVVHRFALRDLVRTISRRVLTRR